MFDRYEAGERAILVHNDFNDDGNREDLHELEMLVSSAGAQALTVVTGSRSKPHPKYYVGSGKAEEIAAAVKLYDADIVIFNHALAPRQERNLEALMECRVLDRTGLILDIFSQRARTHEGKLQVELAQLRHLSTRLIRGWTHLERQKGGIGLRGPGETQLETDRRLIRARMSSILRRLDKVVTQRDQGRRSRKRREIPTISLVGYTNAGKSTLFNHLTGSDVYAADQLFATLDPTLRRISVADVGEVVLADTVGFIRHLPHDLVAAFKATLTETREADLLLHVVDCADEKMQGNIAEVESVLAEIDADEVPSLMICNKIDKLDDGKCRIDYDDDNKPIRVWLSAMSGQGTELLYQALTELLAGTMKIVRLQLPSTQGNIASHLYNLNCIEYEAFAENGDWLLDVRMTMIDWQRLKKHKCNNIENFILSQ
ncbi:MAG: GTP-binding protein HflX [Moritella sp.]